MFLCAQCVARLHLLLLLLLLLLLPLLLLPLLLLLLFTPTPNPTFKDHDEYLYRLTAQNDLPYPLAAPGGHWENCDPRGLSSRPLYDGSAKRPSSQNGCSWDPRRSSTLSPGCPGGHWENCEPQGLSSNRRESYGPQLFACRASPGSRGIF